MTLSLPGNTQMEPRQAELVSASMPQHLRMNNDDQTCAHSEAWMLKQVQGDGVPHTIPNRKTNA
jgi:hypothetical protein